MKTNCGGLTRIHCTYIIIYIHNMKKDSLHTYFMYCSFSSKITVIWCHHCCGVFFWFTPPFIDIRFTIHSPCTPPPPPTESPGREHHCGQHARSTACCTSADGSDGSLGHIIHQWLYWGYSWRNTVSRCYSTSAEQPICPLVGGRHSHTPTSTCVFQFCIHKLMVCCLWNQYSFYVCACTGTDFLYL